MKTKLLRQLRPQLSTVNAHGVCSVLETVRVPLPKGAVCHIHLARLADGWRFGYERGLVGSGVGCWKTSCGPWQSTKSHATREEAIQMALAEAITAFSARHSSTVQARNRKALAAIIRYQQSHFSQENPSMAVTVAPKKFKPPVTKRKLSDGPPSVAVGKLTHGPVPRPAKAESTEPAERWQDLPPAAVVACDIAMLARHPANRVPSPENVERMRASLRKEGQLEPLLIWYPPDMPSGRRQIISGETRWLAARAEGWETVQVREITGIDAARALELLALANSERSDLDPIEKAKLAVELCKPVAEGGSGFTRDQAAMALRFKGGGAVVSNLVSLLRLPPAWQALVASGELSQRLAREIVPVAHIPAVMADLMDDWQGHLAAVKEGGSDDDNFRNVEALQDAIDHILRERLRILDQPRHYGGNGIPAAAAGHYACLIDDAYRDELDLVEIEVPNGKMPKKVYAAQNVGRYDVLQRQAIVLSYEASQRKAAKKVGAKADKEDAGARNQGTGDRGQGASGKLTKAQEEARTEQQAEVLSGRIAAWRHRVLCELVAERLAPTNAGTWRWLFWLLAERTYHVGEVIDRVLPDNGSDSDEPLFDLLSAHEERDVIAKLIDVARGYLLLPDSNPKFPRTPTWIVEHLAAQVGVDLPLYWVNLWIAKPRGPWEPTLEAFLQAHSAEQLDAFASQSFGVYLERTKTKQGKIDYLLGIGRPCRMPDSIAPLPAVEKTGKQKSTKVAKRGAK